MSQEQIAIFTIDSMPQHSWKQVLHTFGEVVKCKIQCTTVLRFDISVVYYIRKFTYVLGIQTCSPCVQVHHFPYKLCTLEAEVSDAT